MVAAGHDPALGGAPCARAILILMLECGIMWCIGADVSSVLIVLTMNTTYDAGRRTHREACLQNVSLYLSADGRWVTTEVGGSAPSTEAGGRRFRANHKVGNLSVRSDQPMHLTASRDAWTAYNSDCIRTRLSEMEEAFVLLYGIVNFEFNIFPLAAGQDRFAPDAGSTLENSWNLEIVDE